MRLEVAPRQGGKWGFNCWYICYCSDTRRPDRKINVTRGRGRRWGNLIMMTLASLRTLISRTWKDILGFFNTIPKCQCFACRVLSGLWSPGVYLCPCCREPLSPQWWPNTDVPCLSKLWASLAVTACSQDRGLPMEQPNSRGSSPWLWGLCKWRLLRQPGGDFLALNFASDAWWALKAGRVAAGCVWVSPLSLGSASSLCPLMESWGCGHRDASVSLPAQPDLTAKNLVFVSSWFCVKNLLVCCKDCCFLPLFYCSALTL